MDAYEISYLAAAAAGVVSFLSPCVLPLVPAYLSFIAGTSLDRLTAGGDPMLGRRVLAAAVAFVLGFTTVFVALGASASVLSALLFRHFDILEKAAGVVIILFGLHFLGVFRRFQVLGFLQREARFHGQARPAGVAGSYVIGLAFAFGWTPCIGPILASILTLAASGDSLGFGVSLLTVYSLGLGLPFIAAALALRSFLAFSGRFLRYLPRVEQGAGVVLVATGALMLAGQFSALAYYLLEWFPSLGLVEANVPDDLGGAAGGWFLWGLLAATVGAGAWFLLRRR